MATAPGSVGAGGGGEVEAAQPTGELLAGASKAPAGAVGGGRLHPLCAGIVEVDRDDVDVVGVAASGGTDVLAVAVGGVGEQQRGLVCGDTWLPKSVTAYATCTRSVTHSTIPLDPL